MKTRIINMARSNGMKRYNILRRGGYRTLWTGEHKICMVKERNITWQQ
jgi:hypothetical protein